MLPSAPTTIPFSPARFVCHGPVSEDAQATVAKLPGARLLQTSAPFWLNDVMTGCPIARLIPVSNDSNIRNVPRLASTVRGRSLTPNGPEKKLGVFLPADVRREYPNEGQDLNHKEHKDHTVKTEVGSHRRGDRVEREPVPLSGDPREPENSG